MEQAGNELLSDVPGCSANALCGHAEVAVQNRAIHGDVHLHSPATAPKTVQLPLPTAVGRCADRTAELPELVTLITEHADSSGHIQAFSTVTGGPGVGKSALVVQWAHRMRDRSPDGELYVNMRGYQEGAPVVTAEGLAGIPRTLAVPAARIRADSETQAGLYRSLRDRRRMLIVLNNASSAAEVRPLLPGSAACTDVVASRSRAAGLVAPDGARRISPDVVPPAECASDRRDLRGPDFYLPALAAPNPTRRCGCWSQARIGTARASLCTSSATPTLRPAIRRANRGLPAVAVDPAHDGQCRRIPATQ